MADVVSEFTHGYCCAVAALIASHGDSQEVTDLLTAIHVTPSIIDRLDPYDARHIKTTDYWKRQTIEGAS